MPDRPFEDRRPIGPLINLENWGYDSKSVLGVSGTPMPNREKNPVVATYVLEGQHIYDLRDRARSEIKELVEMRLRRASVKSLQSGSKAAAPFDNQAIVVTIPGEALPIQDSELHDLSSAIDRYMVEEVGMDTSVKALFIDQE